MPELPPHLIAALTGFSFGLVLCLPVGPVNLAIVEGARRGFKWAALIGLGATVMEVIYCALAFTSFAAFFQKGIVKSAMEVFSFAFMLFLGVRFLIAKPGPVLEKLEHSFETRIEEKLHPHSAFMIVSCGLWPTRACSSAGWFWWQTSSPGDGWNLTGRANFPA
jgi:threonine/homoserine/homoserine lactone efflux protein